MINISSFDNFDAIFFDLDGTLIEGSDAHFAKALAMTAKKFNLPELEHTRGTLLFPFLRLHFPDWNEEQVQYFIEENIKTCQKLTRNVSFHNDVEHILNITKNHPRGIVTNCNASELQRTKDYLDLDFVDTIVYKTERINGKPEPDLYLKAAENFNVDPKKCLVFEDSHVGIHAGKNANMTVIAIDRFNDLGKTSADHTITSFFDIS